MKRLFTLVVVAFLASASYAQDPVAINFIDVDDYGIDIAQLDSLHGPALDADPSKSMFPEDQDKVAKEWGSLLNAFSENLTKEGFQWDRPLRGFYRFYFTPDGNIHKVIYQVPGLEDDQVEQFGEVLNMFAKSYKVDLTAQDGFAQCSPATLTPPTP